MFWNYLILVLGTISATFALPYGKWEMLQKNKIGGIIVFLISTVCVTISILQIII